MSMNSPHRYQTSHYLTMRSLSVTNIIREIHVFVLMDRAPLEITDAPGLRTTALDTSFKCTRKYIQYIYDLSRNI